MLALPKLQKGKKWYKIADSSRNENIFSYDAAPSKDQQFVQMEPQAVLYPYWKMINAVKHFITITRHKKISYWPDVLRSDFISRDCSMICQKYSPAEFLVGCE